MNFIGTLEPIDNTCCRDLTTSTGTIAVQYAPPAIPPDNAAFNVGFSLVCSEIIP